VKAAWRHQAWRQRHGVNGSGIRRKQNGISAQNIAHQRGGASVSIRTTASARSRGRHQRHIARAAAWHQ
jgi:hypothetical protein